MYYGEKFNSITHLLGAVLALMGFGALLAISIQINEPEIIASFTIFGLTLVLLYTVSTLYHSFYPPRLKKLFQKLDHISIYLLIAGTYTPYMLVSLGDGNGLIMLTIVWGLAVIGILLDTLIKRRIEIIQLPIYLIMGWICILEYNNQKLTIESTGMFWLIIGGIAYTSGIVFYVLDDMNKLRHSHGIWHLFVLSGSISHFISVIGYVR
ncbi:MAG: hemolysin III family protein [Gammaproteobacteria bacterium]|nr:hemolysin III family protein [Gammaproteobacteria bacterium]